MWLPIEIIIPETRLPIAPFSSAPRTLTGAIATSDSAGNSCLAVRYLRNAPPHRLTTVSLTVAPLTRLRIARMSSRLKRQKPITRCARDGLVETRAGNRRRCLQPVDRPGSTSPLPLQAANARTSRPRAHGCSALLAKLRNISSATCGSCFTAPRLGRRRYLRAAPASGHAAIRQDRRWRRHRSHSDASW